MPRRTGKCAIRSFREGDQETLAHLFNEYLHGFVGPVRVTPESWRDQYRRAGWTTPSLDSDPDCVRVAERDGEVIGYAVTDYSPFHLTHGALVQELCVMDVDDAAGVADALLADAEARALQRGKSFIDLALSPEDGRALSATSARGYDTHSDTGSVFMAVILDIAAFLVEVRDELSRRLDESPFREWAGAVEISGGQQSCLLRMAGSGLSIESGEGAREADISVQVEPDAVAPLLMGRVSVEELYLQDALAIAAADREKALRLLAVLFPRLPIYLPRAQWW
jgi:hypothetical protein